MVASSTLLVVKLFQEAFELDTTPGRLALGLLVFQDLWATVFILLQPRLDAPEVLPIIGSFAGRAILTGVAILVSRTVLPALFDTMGMAGLFVAFAFYVLMLVAALTSSISSLDAFS